MVVRGAVRRRLPEPAEVVLEDGTVLPEAPVLPAGLPHGYHRLRTASGEVPLIVSPGRCPVPPGRTWGWSIQLYGLRSERSWGMGDLGDLADTARWSAGQGAGLLLVNPLHAAVPVIPRQTSPYYPSSRRWRDPLWLRVEDVPGAAAVPDVEAAAQAGRALLADRHVDRDAVHRLKWRALESIWQTVSPADRAAGDPDLVDFATHCTLAEVHGPAWRRWPAALQDPRSAAVAAERERHRDRVLFHCWLQRQVQAQLAAAAAPLTLLHDLAVGVDPEGADAWLLGPVIAPGVRVGAPPDDFARDGQDWGVAAFDPWRLRADGYRPFTQMIRAVLSGGGGLRVDHVMGLFRLYWIPPGAEPAQGVYVRYPADDLLDILALECERAGAIVCGEDLGTVEPEVRERLAQRRVLSYRLLWFEDAPPEEWPELALAAATTHDLPTVAGLWTRRDLDLQRAAGAEPAEDSLEVVRARAAAAAGVAGDASVAEMVDGVHRALARARSRLVCATLEDALEIVERPNIPGTTASTNWSTALPLSLEQVTADPRPARLARLLGAGRGPLGAPAPGSAGTRTSASGARPEPARPRPRRSGGRAGPTGRAPR